MKSPSSGRRIIASIRCLSSDSAAAVEYRSTAGADDDDPVAVFLRLLKSCVGRSDLAKGRSIYAQILASGSRGKLCLWNQVIEMYGRCGSMIEAKQVFDDLQGRTNRYSWGILICAYAHNGLMEEAEFLFRIFPFKDRKTCTAMLSGFVAVGQIHKARSIFHGATQRDLLLWGVMLKSYASAGDLEQSVALFTKMPSRDFASWTTMITGYSKCGHIESAKLLFDTMPERDAIAWNAIISAFTVNSCLDEAKFLLRLMPQLESITWTSMLSMLALAGDIDDARRIFDSMPQRDSTSWKAMQMAYSLAGNILEAKSLFDRSPQWDAATCSMIISSGNFENAEEIFQSIAEKDPIAWSAMLMGYAREGNIRKAKAVFDEMPVRDVLAWTGMVGAYLQVADVDAGVAVFDGMPMTDVAAWNAVISGGGNIRQSIDMFTRIPARNLVTWNSILHAYASSDEPGKECRAVFDRMPHHDAMSRVLLATSYRGTSVEALHKKLELLDNLPDAHVATMNTKVAAYAKAGHLAQAREVFDGIFPCGLVSYNAMLAAYTFNGHLSAGLDLFYNMNLEGVYPNDITFLTILIGCRHKGFLEEGRNFFVFMVGDYGIEARIEHYYAMVDLLGRAKQLLRAESLVESMPFLPDSFAWANLLGACTTLGDVVRAERMMENVVDINPLYSTPYVLLSNVYAQDGSNFN